MTGLEIKFVKFGQKLNKLFPKGSERCYCSAIITAAGSGSRMGGVIKQLMLLQGKPCFIYSALAFEACSRIREIVITAKSEHVSEIKRLCEEYGITKLKCVAVGGATRQESVAAGFAEISPKSELVAIHDAARPLISTEQIDHLLDEAKRYGASALAQRVSDTVKRGDQNGVILETVPRENLFLAQTPQVFKCDLYRVSLALAEKDHFTATDDCSLAEHAGFSVKLCENPSPNIKLTTPSDIQMLNKILEEKKNG